MKDELEALKARVSELEAKLAESEKSVHRLQRTWSGLDVFPDRYGNGWHVQPTHPYGSGHMLGRSLAGPFSTEARAREALHVLKGIVDESVRLKEKPCPVCAKEEKQFSEFARREKGAPWE